MEVLLLFSCTQTSISVQRYLKEGWCTIWWINCDVKPTSIEDMITLWDSIYRPVYITISGYSHEFVKLPPAYMFQTAGTSCPIVLDGLQRCHLLQPNRKHTYAALFCSPGFILYFTSFIGFNLAPLSFLLGYCFILFLIIVLVWTYPFSDLMIVLICIYVFVIHFFN